MSYLDIVLSDKEIASCGNGKSKDYYLKQLKASKYISQTFNADSKERAAGRCFYIGDVTYTKKDGGQITDEDVEAALAICRGQLQAVTKRESHSFTIHWEVDSSD